MRVYAAFFCIAFISCQKPVSQPASEQRATPAPAAVAAPATPPPEPVISYPLKAGARTVFASGHAGDGLRWQAGLSPCSGNRCPITLWLVEGETVIDTKPLAWPANSPELRQEELEPGWGAGDPMGSAANVSAWVSGEEERYIGTVARPVKMGNVTSILVDQLRGFEHLRRNHELFVVRNRRLDRVWQGEEGAGPAWSSTDIVTLPNGAEGVVYYSGFRYPSSAEPDRLEITLLHWDQDVLHKGQEDAPRQAVVVGTFPSVTAAHQARDSTRDCLGAFWVLPASRFPGRSGGFLLALPGVTPERVRQRLEIVGKCAYNRKVEVVTLR
jgi:hypothetical protein